MSATRIRAISEHASEADEPDVDGDGPLSAIDTLSPAEQDGLLWEHGELVADHMVNDFSRRTPHLACVQAKLMVANAEQSFISRQFALEYCLRYEVTLPGLARLGLPIPLGGTSNHFRTAVLRELGGWDAWNVTEDADLGMRCSALGYRVEVVDSITHGEMPH